MATSDTFAFWMVFCIILSIQIIVPVISIGLNEFYIDRSMPEVTSAPTISDYFTLGALEFIAIPFWTFSLPVYINLFFMLPLRILAWILILRMIRGN